MTQKTRFRDSLTPKLNQLTKTHVTYKYINTYNLYIYIYLVVLREGVNGSGCGGGGVDDRGRSGADVGSGVLRRSRYGGGGVL